MKPGSQIRISAHPGIPILRFLGSINSARFSSIQASPARLTAYALLLAAVLGMAASTTILVAEHHDERDRLLHNGAATLILLIIMLLLASGWILLRMAERLDRQPERAVQSDAALQQLVKEKEAAEAANLAKTRYLASISHEIRSPLNSIYGYAQLVERGDGISAAEAARIIARSAEHLTSLVDGLLDISQVEHGLLKFNNEVTRLPAFIDQIIGMFRQMAITKGIDLIYEPPERLPEFVRMDQKRLRQVLINLLSNAIKFTDSGSVRLKVRYSGQVARFEVIDTGPGIAPQDQQRIFAPFERAAAENSGKTGVGLGLTITRALVQIIGGDLELESEPGVGSTFRVTLMLGLFAGVMQDTAPMTRIIGYQGPRKTILVVDDDLQQLALAARVLRSKGLEVLEATSGEMALALAASAEIDLALLDISMPGLSGWDVAEGLRERLGTKLRIVMLSANVDEAEGPPRDDGRLHNLFLSKPIEIEALVENIGKQLALRWEIEPASAPITARTAPEEGTSLPEAAWPHIQRLRELLRIGHVRCIEDEIELLREAAPETDMLADRLLACLDRLDLPAMASQLERAAGGQHA